MTDFKKLLQQWVMMMIGVFLASQVISGIHYETAGALVAVVIILSFLNVMLRPILILFALPFVILTMGFGILVINALLFLLVDKLVPGFSVDGFWSAFWGALLVSIVGFIVNLLIGSRQMEVEIHTSTNTHAQPHRNERKRELKDDDVIDI